MTLGLAGVVVLCGAAISPLGPRDRGVSMGSPREGEPSVAVRADGAQENRAEVARLDEKGGSDPIHLDAPMYAKDFGVSLEEADRRLDMQGDTLPTYLKHELKRTERDTFVGLWLRHEPDYGITVATVGAPKAMMDKIEPVVAETQWEGTVNVKRVEATEAELNAARAEAERMLDRLGISYSSGDNVYKNRMEIYVKEKARVERKLRASGRRLPEHVVLIEAWITPQ